MAEKLEFKKGDFVVYPAHGVGRIEGIDSFAVAGENVMLYSISFEQDRMRLKVPVSKAKTSGLRRLSSRDRIKEALTTLQGR
ncbi:MAG: CarD family transcriptional regulator, partial [Alphaproteobacteria bacterium]|nr:CarD family transcriptional regulator [Alphaproteobacteria bacterium]